ncbi:hypothetical protein BJF92_12185 [Rhizobium rhizosphaerae]|uniref:Phage tail tube protein n=1 Tax=Xaviernesmea rhizosphaerae TaxID=1672749 RepID=A0A1Q9AN69_9HYPH|nr:phage tail tube protein [Xaviernesmea rhizosphaerae]OLP56823.1 hypothetical protein BJF92_12185 [Xaviernesmea rhizosphaerae]
MAGKDFGGKISFRLSSGPVMSLRGTFSVLVASQTNEAITNQNGSTDRVGTPTSPRANVAFADGGIDYAALMKAPRMSVTIVEEFTGVTHHFINAFFSGDPENNRMNGEVSGLTLVGEVYRKTGG